MLARNRTQVVRLSATAFSLWLALAVPALLAIGLGYYFQRQSTPASLPAARGSGTPSADLVSTLAADLVRAELFARTHEQIHHIWPTLRARQLLVLGASPRARAGWSRRRCGRCTRRDTRAMRSNAGRALVRPAGAHAPPRGVCDPDCARAPAQRAEGRWPRTRAEPWASLRR